jgi:hypothetical protein
VTLQPKTKTFLLLHHPQAQAPFDTWSAVADALAEFAEQQAMKQGATAQHPATLEQVDRAARLLAATRSSESAWTAVIVDDQVCLCC